MSDLLMVALAAGGGGILVGAAVVMLYAGWKYDQAQRARWERRNLDSRADDEIDRVLRRAGL